MKTACGRVYIHIRRVERAKKTHDDAPVGDNLERDRSRVLLRLLCVLLACLSVRFDGRPMEVVPFVPQFAQVLIRVHQFTWA